jgi:anti-anti-sigma factor
MSILNAAVTAGESGPVLVLSGEADITTTRELSKLLTAQLVDGTTHLTIDITELRFADSATINILLRVALTLKDRSGTLTLLRPQQTVARALTILGAYKLITLREAPHAQPSPGNVSSPG